MGVGPAGRPTPSPQRPGVVGVGCWVGQPGRSRPSTGGLRRCRLWHRALLADLAQRGITTMTMWPPPPPRRGTFQGPVPHRPAGGHGHLPGPAQGSDYRGPRRWRVARFGRACAVCPLAWACTSSRAGRTVTIHPHEAHQAARGRQRDPAWRADYRAHRPRVQRSWPICCAAATAGDAPACGAGCGWRRTGGCWPPRSTWPASLPWASPTDPAAGPWLPPEPQGRGGRR
jgi:hypothetical protein